MLKSSTKQGKGRGNLTRRKFLVRGAGLGSAAMLGLYVRPSFKSLGFPAAYASISPPPGSQCVVLIPGFDEFPEAARLHDEVISQDHRDILRNAYCIDRITVKYRDDPDKDGIGNPFSPSTYPLGAIVFNSSSPTGGDTDLGTPNEDFGGPGIGSGGGIGGGGPNTTAQGNILIIQENAAGANGFIPDDQALGGKIIFEFSSPLQVLEVHILDIDQDENTSKSWVRTYDPSESLISQVGMHGLGDNSFQKLAVNDSNVKWLVVRFWSSGGLAGLCLCK